MERGSKMSDAPSKKGSEVREHSDVESGVIVWFLCIRVAVKSRASPRPRKAAVDFAGFPGLMAFQIIVQRRLSFARLFRTLSQYRLQEACAFVSAARC